MSNTGARKYVLVTGCTPGGIGHALCKEFHAQGFHVIATARRPEVMADLREAGMTVIPLDVTDSKSIASCKEEVRQVTGGRLDVLVNNAGLTHTVPATDIDMDEVRKTFETNVFGVMAMVQAFTPFLIPTRGLIVMISSVSSVTPYIFGSVYCSSKGALNSYSRTLRQELRPFGVRVMVSMTGTIKSQIAKLDRSLPPDSLYLPIKDAYARRLLFSQNNATIETHEYATALVKEVLKGEGWLGGWIGAATNWFWAGGMTTQIRLGRLIFGEWLLDLISYRRFELNRLEDMVKAAESKRSA
ncbi:short chain dehydrogenase [Plectosphaerella plurivora]|uniref:Short chain dehydrogenase n=1 Tax=Plectosphaerella plurivora TaxID=936078 RepID=A0A9P9AA67_9PEZI|nr:short chain dehydrogenase [Plectosphaerella plurivora]